MNRLKDKITLVTGASDGIGFEVAKAFAGESAAVVMVARNPDKLKAKAKQLQDCGLKVLPIPGDVGCTADVQHAVQAAIEQFGRLDVLVNNAAVAIPGDITDQSDDDWNHLLNINLLGIFRGIKYALPSMLARKSGSIINVASIQGDRSWDHWTTYAAAKGAMKAMTRQLAGQYGSQGVRFNCISPGAMKTPMNEARRESEGEDLYESYSRMHALGRMGEANEVNGAAIFLASDESAFVTGIDLLVDGGLSVLPRS
jgi:NAD(P)-dependent dehydrogenase (short-subunit alcohol dehydrogenase family)